MPDVEINGFDDRLKIIYFFYVIAMSFPMTGMDDSYCNSLQEVTKMLRTKHGKNYMVSHLPMDVVVSQQTTTRQRQISQPGNTWNLTLSAFFFIVFHYHVWLDFQFIRTSQWHVTFEQPSDAVRVARIPGASSRKALQCLQGDGFVVEFRSTTCCRPSL